MTKADAGTRPAIVCGTFVYDDPKKIEYELDVLEDSNAESIVY